MRYLGRLYPQPPYRFSLLLDILARYQHPVTDIAREGGYWRLLSGARGRALVRVVASEGAGGLDVYIAAQEGEVADDWVLSQVGRILGVDADLRAFYDFARRDSALWPVIAPLVGLPQHRTPTVFEAVMLTIMEQQIAWVAAQRGQSWLVRWGGAVLWHDGRPYYAFPTPQQLATATVAELAPLKITHRRMRTMIALAQQVAAGALDLEALARVSPAEAYAQLMRLNGIGHWSATWIVTRTMGAAHPYVGYNDVALQAAVNHYYEGRAGRATPDAVSARFGRWGVYAGMAAYYTITRWVLDRYTPPNGSSS